MALAKDLSGLPSVAPHGEPPVKHPTIGPMLAQAWADKFTDTEEHPFDLPMAGEGARIRHSWAGNCARQIGYRLTDTPVSNELTIADHWRFGLGHAVHDQLQQVVTDAFPGATGEVEVFLEDGLLAGHVDLEIDDVGYNGEDGLDTHTKISVELKTINGFGFKKAVGARGPADGPRTGAKMQGALNALAGDADEMVVIYLSMENLGPRERDKLGTDEIGRFCAEWHYTREEWEPWAEAERDRLMGVIAEVDAGVIPPAYIPLEMPEGATIVDPVKGTWTLLDAVGHVADAGSTWMCNYCPFQDQCITDFKLERKAA